MECHFEPGSFMAAPSYMLEFSVTDIMALMILLLVMQIINFCLNVQVVWKLPKPLTRLCQSIKQMNNVHIDQQTVNQMRRTNYLFLLFYLIITFAVSSMNVISMPKCQNGNAFIKVSVKSILHNSGKFVAHLDFMFIFRSSRLPSHLLFIAASIEILERCFFVLNFSNMKIYVVQSKYSTLRAS